MYTLISLTYILSLILPPYLIILSIHLSNKMEFLTMVYLMIPLSYTFYVLCKRLIAKRNQQCYLLHYECFKPPEDRMIRPELAATIAFRNKRIDVEEFRFLLRTTLNSGISNSSYIPKTVVEGREECPSLEADSLAELDEMMFDTLDKLFSKTGMSPSDIDILVVNVSLLSPSPSLTSRVVKHYGMKHNIRTYNISGMGCSASIIAVDLVQHLLKVHPNVNAIVISTECMGSHWYSGTERSFMLSNCLFRQGACSMLFTNNPNQKHRAQLKLKCLVRTHIGADDEAYKCCYGEEDDKGYEGFRLTRHLPKAAAQALKENLKVIVPKIIPLWEIIRYLLISRIFPTTKNLNLKAGVDHFCIHPGGRAIIEGTGKGLNLSEYDLEPSRMTLYRWGNSSSSGFWYVLGYMEAKKRLKKGDKILMMSFGAGFKSNNCLWEVMSDKMEDRNVWDECIDEYPPKIVDNTMMEKYGWINDESLNFVRLHR